MIPKSPITHCLALAGLMLVGCQNTPKPSAAVTEKPDADLVMMSGVGGRQAAGSAFGLKPMTLEELTACGKRLVAMNQESAQLKVLIKKLTAKKADIARQVEELEVERSKVDVGSRQKVADFNRRLEQNRDVISQYNSQSEDYNGKVNALSLESNQFNANCASRAYRASDAEKLPADLLAAMRGNSQVTDIPLIDDGLKSESHPTEGTHLPGTSSRR
ncbi:hypothetical protein RO575_00260 [Methylomonas sp. MO1]|uniref:hypothetical protein n=1 Tax=unclassified Methylomonas TaxID=2608980 RepID=UPI00047CFF3A|nr:MULTISPECIES: hypothetical protein [unclassified Methylomonas]MDT4287984.1 hypothetical protein [Methylomonas sp. MO1]